LILRFNSAAELVGVGWVSSTAPLRLMPNTDAAVVAAKVLPRKMRRE